MLQIASCINYLSNSELPRLGQRQVFCYNPFYGVVSQRPDLNFKIDTKNKTGQNRKQKVK